MPDGFNMQHTSRTVASNNAYYVGNEVLETLPTTQAQLYAAPAHLLSYPLPSPASFLLPTERNVCPPALRAARVPC